MRDIPAIGRAVVAAARFARRNRRRAGSATARPPRHLRRAAGADEIVTLPTATIFRRCRRVGRPRTRHSGGTSNTLLAGLAARLAQRVGRVAADGSVTPSIPVNERTADDTRANAITNVDITVDPAPAATDLREIRAAIKQALIRHREVPDERWALLPLVPLLPQRLARRMVGVATGGATNVVSHPTRCGPPGRQPARRHRRRLLRHAVSLPGRDQGDDAPHRRGIGLALGKSAPTGLRLGPCISARAVPTRMTNCGSDISSVLSEFSLTATIGLAKL